MKELPVSEYLNLIKIKDGFEQVDFTFFGYCKDRLIKKEEGIKEFFWSSKGELEKMEDLDHKTKKYALEVIERYNEIL